MLRGEVLRSIDDIGVDDWNAIAAPGELIRQHAFLRAVEVSCINDCRYFYPVVRDEAGEVVAHACLYFISTELDLFAAGRLKSLIRGVRKLWPRFMIMRSLECGTPVALGSTISMRDGVDVGEALDVLMALTDEIACELRVKVVLYRDFYDEDLPRYDALQRYGYSRIRNLPTVRLALPWCTFEGYLDAMRSTYRRKINLRVRQFRNAGCTLRVVRDYAPYADRVADLWHRTFDRATEYKREVLLADFFRNLCCGVGDGSAMVLAEHDGLIIGFLLLLKSGDTLVPDYCGMDYEYSLRAGAYFNVFYESVRYAIDNDYNRIDFGITTLAAKMDFGGTVVGQHMYMRNTGLSGRLLPRLFDMMTPAAGIRSRNVFRE